MSIPWGRKMYLCLDNDIQRCHYTQELTQCPEWLHQGGKSPIASKHLWKAPLMQSLQLWRLMTKTEISETRECSVMFFPASCQQPQLPRGRVLLACSSNWVPAAWDRGRKKFLKRMLKAQSEKERCAIGHPSVMGGSKTMKTKRFKPWKLNPSNHGNRQKNIW